METPTTPSITVVTPPQRNACCLPLAIAGCAVPVLGAITGAVLLFGVLFTSVFGAMRAGECPAEQPIKAGSSLIYGKAYAAPTDRSMLTQITREACYATTAEAEAAGYHLAISSDEKNRR